MVVILKPDLKEEKIREVSQWLESFGVDVNVVRGSHMTIVGLIGDTAKIDMDMVRNNAYVEDVKRIQDPFKSVNRKFHPDDTVVQVGEHCIGGEQFQVIAGPCSVESREQITYVAQRVKAAGAHFLRGGRV